MEHNQNVTHTPVLVEEVLSYLEVKPHGRYLDVTFGGGGHTRAILEAQKNSHVVALDWDKETIEAYGPALTEHYGNRIELIWSNFAQLYQVMKKKKLKPFDGILADFGTSRMQIFDKPGMSFQRDTPLDMRMSGGHYPITAAHVINSASEEKLFQIFAQLGEERYARRIAHAIVERRKQKEFSTTLDLAGVVAKAVPSKGKIQRIHPATRVFQALRIYVNHELENINAFLVAAMKALKPGGRLVCISFHSLEDRIVKQFFKEQEDAGVAQVLTKRVVVPTEQEVIANPASRSAKLRALELVREVK